MGFVVPAALLFPRQSARSSETRPVLCLTVLIYKKGPNAPSIAKVRRRFSDFLRKVLSVSVRLKLQREVFNFSKTSVIANRRRGSSKPMPHFGDTRVRAAISFSLTSNSRSCLILRLTEASGVVSDPHVLVDSAYQRSGQRHCAT